MPPPLVEEEESEHHEASASESDDSFDIESPIEAGFPKVASLSHQLFEIPQDVHSEPQGQEPREASPVPMVVSDVVTHNVTEQMPAEEPTLKPTEFKGKARGRGRKRARDPTRMSQGTLAKRRKGNKRSIPCVYCVRRLANDPKWACHDALVGQSGASNYKGVRCGGCVSAHVSCQLIPDNAVESVRILAKAAADVAAGDGINNVQLLAAYEAAIGPALRSIIVIPETHASEPQKQKTKKTPSLKPHPSYSKRRPPSTSSPWAATPTQSFSGGAGARQQQQQEHHYTQADPANFFAPPPPPPPHQHHQDGGADLERLERQALRRRKVEALESISHTAALFLAEFMTFANRQISSASSEGANVGEPDERGEQYSSAGGSVPAQNCGMDYAAAAAEMAASIFRSSAEAPLKAANDSESDNDSADADASTIVNNDRAPVVDAQTSAVLNEDDLDMVSGSSDSEEDLVGRQESEVKVEEE